MSDRPPTPSERIAASRKELDDATTKWHAAVQELERLEGLRDAAVAPYVDPIAKAAAQVDWHKQRVREAMNRLDASGPRR